MTETINRKRPRGQQRWMDTIKSDLQNCDPGSRLEESEDRERRREIVEAAKALHLL